uniref:Uncharacterized protein n=1 Tax=Meloidogyne enterolobii TaxID=390850 RepID=A0A6V7VU76_MELEN|nr:unnamed protein product [Meloidogyne enterolobii]
MISKFSFAQLANVSTFFVSLILGLTEICALFWILRQNKRNYDKKFQEGHQSLSERYQLSENIRTAKQLIPCILMHFVCIILPGINNTFAYLKIYSDNFTIDFANQCVFIIVTIGSFLIELFLLIYHPFLRRNFFRLLCSLFCCRMFFPINKVMQVPPTTDTNILTQSNIRTGKDGGALKDINGKPLIIKGKKEDLGEAYFQQLVTSWK